MDLRVVFMSSVQATIGRPERNACSCSSLDAKMCMDL
jgi:hypothetical protein